MPLILAPAITPQKRGGAVLYKLIAALLLLWLTGMVTFIMLGGLIHLFLIIALFVLVVELMTEENAWYG
jgi:predicted membrane protein